MKFPNGPREDILQSRQPNSSGDDAQKFSLAIHNSGAKPYRPYAAGVFRDLRVPHMQFASIPHMLKPFLIAAVLSDSARIGADEDPAAGIGHS